MHGIINLVSDVFWTMFPPLMFIGTGIALANVYEFCGRKYAGWKWRRAKAAWEASLLRKQNQEAQEAKDAAKQRVALHSTIQANTTAHAKMFGHTR